MLIPAAFCTKCTYIYCIELFFSSQTGSSIIQGFNRCCSSSVSTRNIIAYTVRCEGRREAVVLIRYICQSFFIVLRFQNHRRNKVKMSTQCCLVFIIVSSEKLCLTYIFLEITQCTNLNPYIIFHPYLNILLSEIVCLHAQWYLHSGSNI